MENSVTVEEAGVDGASSGRGTIPIFGSSALTQINSHPEPDATKRVALTVIENKVHGVLGNERKETCCETNKTGFSRVF